MKTATPPNLPAVWQLGRHVSGIFGPEDLSVQLAQALTSFDYCHADRSGLLIDAANRGAPVLDLRRYNRFGRQLGTMLDRSLHARAGRPPLTAATAR